VFHVHVAGVSTTHVAHRVVGHVELVMVHGVAASTPLIGNIDIVNNMNMNTLINVIVAVVDVDVDVRLPLVVSTASHNCCCCWGSTI
jgi:hypothetical protein